MNFEKLLNKRRACHNFQAGVTIPKKDIETIITEAGLSPSGYNCQPWEFIAIQKKENLKKIYEIAFKQEHLKNASAVIIVLADTNIGRNVDALLKDWVKFGYCSEEEVPVYRNSIAKNRNPQKKETMALRNAMLACMTLIYSAENLGYSTCPMMGFNHTLLEEFLEIPEDRVVALMIAIGKEDKNAKKLERLPRKPLSQILRYEKWS
jgi:putative NAD(P)H nitroreductase